MYYTAVLTIRLDDNLEMLWKKAYDFAGRSKSEVVREALRRQLVLTTFEKLRRESIPYAMKAGYMSEEDVFEEVS